MSFRKLANIRRQRRKDMNPKGKMATGDELWSPLSCGLRMGTGNDRWWPHSIAAHRRQATLAKKIKKALYTVATANLVQFVAHFTHLSGAGIHTFHKILIDSKDDDMGGI